MFPHANLKLGLKERYKGTALKNCIEVRQGINGTPLPAISCLWGVLSLPPASSSQAGDDGHSLLQLVTRGVCNIFLKH